MFRRWRCEHDWHKTNEVDFVDCAGNYVESKCYIYCPKCRMRKVIRPHLWAMLQNERKLRNAYIEGGDCGDR